MAKGIDPTLLGRTIAGKFAIESYIGAGAMGAVYRARQLALEKLVAVKVLHRELTHDEAFTNRFKREAKAASRLDHPNSMRVIDFGVEADGLLYIAMELLEGRDLLKVIVEDWPLSGTRISNLLMQALAALAVAHDMGVVHRDLKPENIMVLKGTNDEGQATDLVKVCDFGIAKITQTRSDAASHGGAAVTAQGLVVGTPEYMSPEQGKGEPLDLRSDIYSMGVILYQLLTGRVPFDAESALGIVFKHVTEEPIRPSAINPMIDKRLEHVCLRAMSKRREDRQQSAREMRLELRAVVEGSTSIVISPSRPFGAEDTAPLPVMPEASTSSPQAVSAPQLPSGSGGTARMGTGSGRWGPLPDPTPKTTSSAALLSDRPRAPPSPVLLGVSAAALGSVLAAAFFLLGGRSHGTSAEGTTSATSSVTHEVAPTDPPPSTVASSPSVVDPAADKVPEAPATGAGKSAHVPSPQHSPPGATAAATQAGQTSTGSTHPAPPPLPAAPAAPGAPTSFNLAVAAATPTVVRASGASSRDVRAALPSAQFTLCYRDALKRAGHRIDGKMSVHIKMNGDGRVSSALVTAGESLTQSVGSCITGAFDGLVIPNVSTPGDADITLVFSPD